MRRLAIFTAAIVAASPAAALQRSPGPMIRGVESPSARMPASSLDQNNLPPDVAQANGPRGTSGDQPRYDTVGYVGIGGAGNPDAITIASDALAPGSFVELTSLDTGRTIIALVAGRGTGGGGVADLSPGTARALGLSGGSAAVRVRAVLPSAQDQGALRAGQSASARSDAPQALLAGLRKRLPAGMSPVASRRPALAPPQVDAEPQAYVPPRVTARPTVRAGASFAPPGETHIPAPRERVASREEAPAPAPAASGGRGWYVQVATLSSLERATALASSLGGGRIVSTGNLHRVQIGPYGGAASADQARDAVIRRGYGGAQIIRPK